MEKYQSKTVHIDLPAEEIFERFSRLDALTPIAGERLEGWQADADTCSFRMQGFTIRLRVAERVRPTLLRLASDQGTPMDFSIALHLDSAAPTGTNLDIALEIELNTMLRMMIGSRLQQGADALADMIAAYLNNYELRR